MMLPKHPPLGTPTRLFTLCVALCWAASVGVATAASAQSHRAAVEKDYDAHLAGLFEHFHRNPELSFLEKKTARRFAKELRKAGVKTVEGVGGTGVVGLLENGEGPLVLVRADMDGLPIREASGLDYASTATQLDQSGREVPVMHACGHDVHMTSLIGTARRLSKMRDQWSGTLMFIGQPAEERIGGARAMLEDGLYDRFGVPDFALALHVMASGPAGRVAVTSGPTAASSDSVDIKVHGVGTHGASPQKGKDPIYLASQIVIALQGLVSRELNPLDPGVITVGSFHGGFKHNVIPDEVDLQLTVRADNEKTRAQLLAGIERIALGVARTAGLPEDQLPEVSVVESTPSNQNDPALTERIIGAFERELGPDAIYQMERDSMGAEDFAYFTQTKESVPGTYFVVGGTSQSELDRFEAAGQPSPSHHSARFKIDPRASITGGTEAMTVAILELLGSK